MKALLPPQLELEDLSQRSAAPFARTLERLAAAELDRNRRDLDSATLDLADQIGATMAIANVMGRRRLLLEIDARAGKRVDLGRAREPGPLGVQASALLDALGARPYAIFAGRDQADPGPGRQALAAQSRSIYAAAAEENPEIPLIPRVPFRQAIEDFESRDPRLSELGTGADVAEMYSREHVFAMAYSARLTVTKRVQELIARSMKRGLDPNRTQERIARLLREEGALNRDVDPAELKAFTRAYAETVYRTNVANAYTAGRFQMATDPDVAEYVPCMEYVTAGDVDVRGNHAAGDGFMAATADPVWAIYASPLGYRCRCAMEMRTIDDAKAAGIVDRHGRIVPGRQRVPGDFTPDKNFGLGRPDLVRR